MKELLENTIMHSYKGLSFGFILKTHVTSLAKRMKPIYISIPAPNKTSTPSLFSVDALSAVEIIHNGAVTLTIRDDSFLLVAASIMSALYKPNPSTSTINSLTMHLAITIISICSSPIYNVILLKNKHVHRMWLHII